MPQPRSKPAPPSSIRPKYDELGVTGFYAASGATYRNPHEAIIQRLLAQVALEWGCDLSNVLDLASTTFALGRSRGDGTASSRAASRCTSPTLQNCPCWRINSLESAQHC